MAVKLADAFVQITARSEGLQKDVAKQLAGLGKVGEQVGKDAGDKFAKEFDAETKDIDGTVKKSLGGLDKFAASTGQSMGSKISSGINKTLKAGVIGVGVAAGGVLAASITKGLGRLQGIDNAQAKLSGLGHEAKAVEGIMDDALAAVKGTAFGLEDAATIAASSVAAGVKPGEDLQRTLKLTGDAATIAGTDLSTMGSIINKVATSDMMQMDVANQMMDAGIPILQMVGEELGVTAEEARKMASDGEVSFETFQSALENGLGGAALKSGDTVQGAFANMQAAAGRFGAKLAEPIFKAAPAVFGSLGGAFDTLGEKLEPLIEDFADWLAPRMESFATETIPKLVDGVMGAVDAFIEFGGWVKDNAEWIKPLAAGIGGAVAAIYAWNTATNIAKGIQIAFNAVMAVNPIMLIVVALAAVTAGLVYFFTQTETGKAVWETFTNFLKSAWSSVSETFTSVWEWIKTNVFDAFGIKVQEVQIWWQNTTGRLKAAWQDVQMVFSAVWEAIKTAVFDAWNWYVDQVKSNWEMVTSALNSAWTFVKDTFTSVWNAIKTAVFDAWNAYVNQVKANWDTVTNALNTAWTWVKDTFTNVWNTIKTVVFDAWNTAVNFLRDTFNTITTTISDKWTWMKDQMSNVWSWIRDNVFDAMGRGLDTLKGWFQDGVDGIAKIWDGLKAAAAKPVRFVVDTVWNNGILAAWNSIAEFLPGIAAKDKIPLGNLGGYATGGVLPGYTPGRDVHEFYSPTGGRIHLSGGEAIMRPEWTRAVGGAGAVERMNRAARSGKLDPNQIRTGNEHAFATGGVWDLGGFANGGVLITTAVQSAMRDVVKSKYPGITLTSATRPGHSGYHGTGHATDWSNGTANTPMQLALAHDIAQTYPGSAQLIYAAPGWASNIYEGSPAGAMDSGVYKTAQAGRHDNHVHWAMTTPPTMQFGGGVFEGGSNGGGVGAAIFNWIADKARSIWSSVVDPIKDKIGGKAKDWEGSSFGEIPGAMFTSLVDAAWSRLSSLFGSGGGSDSGSVDTSNVPGDVVGAVETVFARHGFTGAEWEAAKWIIQKESNWSPTAQNPSSGAFGLFQFNPMGGNTLGAYLPDRSTDPAVQADAGARYIKDRYGTPSAAKRFWEQNQWYANGGVIPSNMGLFDTGGVWKPGTMGMNLSGKNEYVFTNRAMRDFQQATESLQVVAEEIGAAFNGGDWGMGELASYIGIELAESIINGAAALGEISRTIGEQAQKSGTDYATTQATGALDVMGLGGLVPLGQKLGAKAWDLYQASPYEVGFNGQSVTVEIEAESDADLIRVAEFKRLADQVHGLDVKVNQRPSAASITRGGVM